ncbi:MAG: T9SS type A sorting domain-containing protein, partial [Cytophagales bacterium]
LRFNQVSSDALVVGAEHLSKTPYYSDFGLHEFFEFCELCNIEPLMVMPISLPDKNDDVESLSEFLDYCLGDESTFWGRKRMNNGRVAPFNLKYLEIGNEQFNQVMPAPGSLRFVEGSDLLWTRENTLHYVDKLTKMAILAKNKYPIIKIGAVGANDFLTQNSYLNLVIDSVWDSLVILNCAKYIDFICPHDYATGPTEASNFLGLMSASENFKKIHQHSQKLIKDSENPNMKVLITEFAVNDDFNKDIQVNFRFKSSLYFALMQIQYQKMGLLGSCLYNLKDDAYFGLIDQKYWESGHMNRKVMKSSGFWALKLFNNLSFDQIINSETDSPTFHSPPMGWMPEVSKSPYVNVLATINFNQDSLALILVNTDTINDFECSIALNPFKMEGNQMMSKALLNSNSSMTLNSYSEPDLIEIIEESVESFSEDTVNLNLPPLSMMGLKFKVSKDLNSFNESFKEVKPEMLIHPNPFDKFLKVEIPNKARKEQFEFQIFSALGSIVVEGKMAENKIISTNQLSPGVYILKVYNQQRVFVKKVFKN